MSKIIAAINLTLDGYCDHDVVTAGKEIHDHYANLVRNADTLLYGRATYHLMEYWRTIIDEPTGIEDMDNFAQAIDQTPKIVFSNTLKNVNWPSARLATKSLGETVRGFKKDGRNDKEVFICSPSLITQLTSLNLIDEFQLCIHPVIAGRGLPLFKNITEKITLKLVNTKVFESGAVIHYCEPIMKM